MMFRSVLAAFSALAVAGSATASGRGLEWVMRDGDESAVLAYEVPNTSDQVLYLGCAKPGGTMSLSAQFDVKGLGPDKPVTLTFSAEGQSVGLKARTETDELFPFAYPAVKEFDAGPLLALLAGPGDVVAKAHKGSVRLSVRGRAKAVEEFRAKCPGK